MKYYIIAGEASGDLHGSNLIRQIKGKDDKAEIRCWGGDKMEAAGGELVKHYRDLAFMGFIEVIKNLPVILRNLSFCKEDIVEFSPDVIVLIDYPGFNLRMAKWLKPKGYRIVYYISPQVWAWKENRVKTIKESVDKMLVILPFEKAFYEKWDYDVEYVGHPLIEVIDEFNAEQQAVAENAGVQNPIIALLPGSRMQEIEKKLPLMLTVVAHFPGYQFVIAKAPSLPENFYDHFTGNFPNVSLYDNKTYQLLSQSTAALVTSGTATLETALFRVPEIICYKGNNISYQIARRLIKIKFIGLVNLIMNKEVVKELIQNDLNEKNLVRELKNILENTKHRENILKDYDALYKLLKAGGNASERAAAAVVAVAEGVS